MPLLHSWSRRDLTPDYTLGTPHTRASKKGQPKGRSFGNGTCTDGIPARTDKLYAFNGETGEVLFDGGGPDEQMSPVRRFSTPIVAGGRHQMSIRAILVR
jgi:hypothetical protein